MTWHQFIKLTRFDRPAGIWLLLWPTLSGLWLAAQGVPSLWLLLVFISGTVVMRAFGCVINDIWDRDFDRYVARTQNRVLTSGEISLRAALWLALLLALIALLLLWPLNGSARSWALLAAVVTASYPLFKRFFPWPQAYLGIAFSLGVPMAFAQIQGHVPLLAWFFVLANICWTLAYDTQYAMVDRDDDQRLGLRSSALTLGQYDVRFIAACYLVYLGLIGALLWQRQGGWLAFIPWLLSVVYSLQLMAWCRDRSRTGCLRAFLANHWLGALTFLAIVLPGLFTV